MFAHHYFPEPVWEPACGAGNLCREMAAWGYEFVATDLLEYGYPAQRAQLDFLTDPPPGPFRSIVTNPPFSRPESDGRPRRGDNPLRRFLRRACRHYHPEHVGMLLPAQGGLQDAYDLSLVGDMGLRLVVFPHGRPKFGHGDGRPPRSLPWPAVWFVWERGYTRPASIVPC